MDTVASIAQQFTDYYYSTFDTDRAALAPLYAEESMLTFETNQVQGVTAIVEKLMSLPFQKVKHQVATLDAQPAGPDGSLLVMVTGKLLLDEEQNPQNYCQSFHLISRAGSYYVRNDVFRLVYG
ncbi:nuclear transport factor 2 [Tricharina praecox]|uniref:nuclear transport factor 2 n=1 Tax=Tricharina praecox TaxID=43433 RepID=UPI002220CE28|nr:nuclear transport factor 2 [Tricharina praecox]KAI5850038.1 nuclear transport factor 2 [Tricharina praecox]